MIVVKFILVFIVIFKFIVVILIVGILIVMVLKWLWNLGKMCLILCVSFVFIGIIDWFVVWVWCKLWWYVLIICWLCIEVWIVVMVLDLIENVLFNILIIGII